MEKWAIINENKTVQEIINQSPEGRYHPSFLIVEVPQYLHPFIDNQYRLTENGLEPPTKKYLSNQMKTIIGNFSKHFENNGITYKNLQFGSQDKNQIRDYIATATKHGKTQNSNYSVKWKIHNDFHILNLHDLQIIFDCFNEYKQSLIEHEHSLFQFIDDCQIESIQDFIEKVNIELEKTWPIPNFKQKEEQ